MPVETLAELFLEAMARERSDYLQHKVDGRYVPISAGELARQVRALATALRTWGLRPGDRVALQAENCPQWPVVDFATLCSGAALVPLYPTLLPEQAAYIVRDSGARIVFARTPEQMEALIARRTKMPAVERFVLLVGESSAQDVVTLAALLAEGASGDDPSAFAERARAVRPEDLATLIYTSGTTGDPKGVMLTHRNIVSNVLAGQQVLAIDSSFTALSFLPLAHAFERTVDYVYFHCGCSIAYAESIQTVAQNFQEVNPHIFVSVPRVYEKVLAKVQETVAASPPLRQKFFRWASEIGRRALPWRLRLERPPGLLGWKLALADRLVFAKIRSRLGGRFRMAVSGGAPLQREVAEFLWGAGIAVYEGYGLTESAPILTVNPQGRAKMGTVGPAIPGVELKIAEDGEILGRGPNIMRGYFNNPKATAETLDADGWLRTGDIGSLDEDGYLVITDRKKELIVNAYGKNIAPAAVENALKASPFIAQAMVVGDRKPFLAALIVPDLSAVRSWAGRRGIALGADADLVREPAVRDLVRGEIDAANAHLAHHEQVHAWEILDREFTLEAGELTPTQKIKRRVIAKTHAATIDRLYQEAHAHG